MRYFCAIARVLIHADCLGLTSLSYFPPNLSLIHPLDWTCAHAHTLTHSFKQTQTYTHRFVAFYFHHHKISRWLNHTYCLGFIERSCFIYRTLEPANFTVSFPIRYLAFVYVWSFVCTLLECLICYSLCIYIYPTKIARGNRIKTSYVTRWCNLCQLLWGLHIHW